MPELLALAFIGEGAADVGIAAGLGAADIGAEAGIAAADAGFAGADIAAGGLAGADVAAAGADASLGLGGAADFAAGGLDTGLGAGAAGITGPEVGAAEFGFGGGLPGDVFGADVSGAASSTAEVGVGGVAPPPTAIGASPVGGFISPETALGTTGQISDVAAGNVGEAFGGGAAPVTGGESAAAVSPAVPGETTLEGGFSNFSQAEAAAAPTTNPAILNANPFTDVGNFTPPVQLDTPAGQALVGGEPAPNSLNFGQGGLNQAAPITPAAPGSPYAPGVVPNVPDIIGPQDTGGGGFDFGSSFQGSGQGLEAETTTIPKTFTPTEPPPPSADPDIVSNVPGIVTDSSGIDIGSVANQGSFFDVPAGTGTSPLNTDFGSIPQSAGADPFSVNPAQITTNVDPFDVTATAEGVDLFSGAGMVPQVPDIMGEFTSQGFTSSPLSEITSTGGFDPNVPGGFSSDLSGATDAASNDLFSGNEEWGPQLQPGGAYNPLAAPAPQQALGPPQIGPFDTTLNQAPPGLGTDVGQVPTIPPTSVAGVNPPPGGLSPAAAGALSSNPLASLFGGKGLNAGQLAALGASGFLLTQQPKVPSATQAAITNAGPLAALGQQNIAQTTPTAIQQAALDKIQQDAINQIRQQYYARGRDPTRDSSYVQAAEDAALRTAALAAGFVQQANQLGVQELQGANQVLTAAGQQQLQVQTNFNNSLMQVSLALARLFGGSAASGGAAASTAAAVA